MFESLNLYDIILIKNSLANRISNLNRPFLQWRLLLMRELSTSLFIYIDYTHQLITIINYLYKLLINVSTFNVMRIEKSILIYFKNLLFICNVIFILYLKLVDYLNQNVKNKTKQYKKYKDACFQPFLFDKSRQTISIEKSTEIVQTLFTKTNCLSECIIMSLNFFEVSFDSFELLLLLFLLLMIYSRWP